MESEIIAAIVVKKVLSFTHRVLPRIVEPLYMAFRIA